MTRRCNLKTCSYIGEVDNMQMICEWTHENILKQWGKSFSKQLEMPGSTYRYQGSKQTSWRTYQVLQISVIAFSLEKQTFTFDSSIAGGPQSVIEACSYFFQGGVTKILAPR